MVAVGLSSFAITVLGRNTRTIRYLGCAMCTVYRVYVSNDMCLILRGSDE